MSIPQDCLRYPGVLAQSLPSPLQHGWTHNALYCDGHVAGMSINQLWDILYPEHRPQLEQRSPAACPLGYSFWTLAGLAGSPA